jgi:uncharacterized membrane protein YdbT with pleckstrin-like domain
MLKSFYLKNTITMQRLDPKAVWLFFFQFSIGSIFTAAMFGCFIPIMALADSYRYTSSPFLWIFLCWLGFSLVAIGFSYFWAILTYNNFGYELHEDGFKIEKGVIFKRYVTIPYERIQNVDIYRGVIARLLGLSDLQIQTAGFSNPMNQYGMGSEGRLPALDKAVAEELRNALVKRTKGQKTQDV